MEAWGPEFRAHIESRAGIKGNNRAWQAPVIPSLWRQWSLEWAGSYTIWNWWALAKDCLDKVKGTQHQLWTCALVQTYMPMHLDLNTCNIHVHMKVYVYCVCVLPASENLSLLPSGSSQHQWQDHTSAPHSSALSGEVEQRWSFPHGCRLGEWIYSAWWAQYAAESP